MVVFMAGNAQYCFKHFCRTKFSHLNHTETHGKSFLVDFCIFLPKNRSETNKKKQCTKKKQNL